MVTRWRRSTSGMKMKMRRGGGEEPSLLDLGPQSKRIDNHSVIKQLFECLNTITNQLRLTVELSSSLQAPHAVAQNTISTFESQVTLLESVVRASQGQECPMSPIVKPILPPPTPDYDDQSSTFSEYICARNGRRLPCHIFLVDMTDHCKSENSDCLLRICQQPPPRRHPWYGRMSDCSWRMEPSSTNEKG